MNSKERFFCFWLLSWICFLSSTQFLKAQSNLYSAHGWQLEDYRSDSVFGAGMNKAYNELLKGKKASPVIVAIIDAGLDTAHEDLVGHIWTNTAEIPGNGIDDDHNGYVDDIHGWNFLGGKDGKNITIESYESYREYYRLINGPNPKNYQDSAYLEKVRKFVVKDSLQFAQAVYFLGQLIPQMKAADSIFKINLHKDSVYARDVAKFQTQDSALVLLKKNTLMYFKKYGVMSEMPLGGFIREADSYLQISIQKLKYFSGDPNLQRREIVGDDYNNINDVNYGNNNIAAGTPTHGTHVCRHYCCFARKWNRHGWYRCAGLYYGTQGCT